MNKDTTRLLEQLRSEIAAARERLAEMEINLDELQRKLESEPELPAPADSTDASAEDEAVDLSAIPVGDFPEDIPTAEPAAETVAESEPSEAPATPAPVRSVRESTDRYAWRKDMPGSQVRDIRSAIALNDRVLFINALFQQDPVRFQDALTALNGCASFDAAEDWLRTNFPQWNYDSDVVYRFMMAVRRKLR